jgi:large subunit ribosomal protein L17
MTTQLITHERIVTTVPKAKELRRFADKMVTLAKRGDLHAKRQAFSFLRTEDSVRKLFADFPERYADRNGGYTRIKRLGVRTSDSAPMCSIEYVQESVEESRRRREFKIMLKKEREHFKREFLTQNRPKIGFFWKEGSATN